jgi:hypothetical protein
VLEVRLQFLGARLEHSGFDAQANGLRVVIRHCRPSSSVIRKASGEAAITDFDDSSSNDLERVRRHLNSFGSVRLAVNNHYVAVLDLRRRGHNIPVSVSAEAISPGESR